MNIFPTKILLATDGSEDAELALRAAVDTAEKTGSELHVVHVGPSADYNGGGKGHYKIESPIENTEVYNDATYGVLKLTLHPSGYDWQFVPVEGEAFTDSASDWCH